MNRRIRENLSNLSDDELIAMLRASRDNYIPFALQAAQDELAKRELFKLSIKQTDQQAIPRKGLSNPGEPSRRGQPKPVDLQSGVIESGECYIEAWRDKNFEGEYICIKGPGEYPVLRAFNMNWEDSISSIRVGPNAFVIVYESRDFKGTMATLGPNEEVPDLSLLRLNNEIDSIKVIDSMKIFDRSRLEFKGKAKSKGRRR